eukprot:jgi/Mesen1/4958/ME000248S04240
MASASADSIPHASSDNKQAHQLEDREGDKAEQSGAGSVFEALAAEAGGEGEEELDDDERARRALACPCVAELRDGPCGESFVEAFTCYIKSKADEKGSDCIKPFLAMQTCIQAHPEAFNFDEEGDDEEKDEQTQQAAQGK